MAGDSAASTSQHEETSVGAPASSSEAPASTSALKDLVLITGYSGAGKSTAMAAFEDEGYFCVDNLPSEMIRSLIDLFMHEGSKIEHAAVASDARGGSYFDGLASMLDELRVSGVKLRVLFLEADEQSLLTRYKETRRRHPLSPRGSVASGITRERTLLAPLRERADLVIDTTGLTAAMLRRRLSSEMLPSSTPGRLAVRFESFGFKYGTVRDPDLMLDVRFLPNPHYDPELRPLTGIDERIVAFINQDGELDRFYERLHPLMDYLLPQYRAEGKAHLVIGIGCTGGRHRSVAIAQHLAERYGGEDAYQIEVFHRDVTRPA
ncbi:MAG: RNase adapter RapZ [Solirubrobacteraceae bacterium]